MDDLKGRTLKGYELGDQLGAGGFGVVYRAYQPLVKRDVAIKVILPVYANHPDFIRRFESEAQLIARLEHPYIVPLYDFWREPDGAYLVMRFFRGGNLRASIKQRTWRIDEVSRLLDQIGSALTVAHRHDIVHRDLKPDNILLDDERNAYLADFGIAKDLTEPTEVSAEGDEDFIVGSPSYLSPEQIRTEPISARTDLYSLGIVLYEMLTGTIPFPGLTPSDTLFRHLTHPLPPLEEKRPDLPAAVDAIIQQATAKNPADRFPDALALAAAFRQAVQADAHTVLPTGEQGEQPTTRMNIVLPGDKGTIVVTEDLIEPENPYKGLRAFQEADAADFFGRASLIDLLVGRLGKIDSDSAPRFLAVVGPSGSGKSSVVKAGMIPALRKGALPGSDRWYVIEMMPGSHPLEELEAALLRIAVNPPASLITQLREDARGLVRAVKRVLPGDSESELLLVIDQFEEVFTMTEDESERAHFLDSLLAAANDPRSPVRVVVTLRADFYDRPLMYADFGALMRQCTEVVLPMTTGELEQAIARPAERVGLKLEPGLTAEIIADIGAQPGSLPLLQYALSELFERRDKRTLKVNVYRESGGVMGALARRADELYNSLGENAQRAARQLFLRLVTLGEGTEDTRRRVRYNELAAVNGDAASSQQVIDAFGKYRLLTFDRDPLTRVPTVEVAHEALIRQWGQLREWIDTSRDQLRTQRRLAAATEEWLHAGRDASFLASGARLDQFEAWSAETDLALNAQESEFLRASIAERERRHAEERARQEHEARLERRSRQFLRTLVIVMALAALGALGLTAVALNQRGIAEENAATATVAQGQAVVEANNARSLALVSGAQLALGSNNTELAISLALEANRVQTSVDAQRTLAQVAYAPGTRKIFTGHTARVMGVAMSPDGTMGLSAARDNLVILWDIATGQEIRRLEGHEDWVWDAAFSPDGKTVLSASQDHTLILWDVATGEQIRRFEGHTDVVSSVAFSADGTQALSGSFDHTMILWDVATGEAVRRFESDGGQIYSVAFSKSGFTALSGNEDGSITLWNVMSGAPLRRFVGHTSTVWDVEYTPDELGALSASDDHNLLLWSFDSEEPIRRFVGHAARVTDAAFSPDGSMIVSSAEDNTLILWDVALGSIIQRYGGQTGPMYGVSFSPDGKHFLSGGWDFNVRLWDVYNGAEIHRYSGHNAPVYWVEYSADGSTILTGGDDNTAILWNAKTGEEIRRFVGHEARVTSVAYSPDGKTILTGSEDRTMRLWDIETGEQIRSFDAHSNSVFCVTYSPDGKTALSGSTDNTIIWWNLETGEQLNRYIGHRWWVSDVLFMPDGLSFVSTSFDFTMIRWDLKTGNQLLVYNGHNDWVRSAVVTPDGKKILSASADSTLILWDADTGERLRTYEGHGTQVQDVALSPDGKLAISGSNDLTLILWDLETGAQLRRITGHEGVIRSVAFRPDGKAVLSGSGDGTAREWQLSLSLDELIDWTMNNRYVRDFTCAEREYYAITPLCPEPTAGVTPGRPA